MATTKRTRKPKVSPEQPELKSLTSEDILSLSTSLDEITPVSIMVKDKKNKKEIPFTINISTHFRDSKLEVIAAKYLGFVQQLRQNPDVTEKTIIGTFKLLPTLLIQEFSDVPIDFEIKSLEDLIHVQNNLGDLGILHQVYNAFDESEKEKAMKTIELTATETGKLMGDVAVQQALKEFSDAGIQITQ